MRFFRRLGRSAPAPPLSDSRAFGYKSAWLAVRAEDPSEVAEALGLRDVTEKPWGHGVGAVFHADPRARPVAVFAGGPVAGWVLVPFGTGLAEPSAFDLAAISRRFGEAQRFATHRVVEAHEWERWVDGVAARRYGYLGESAEVVFDEGEPTEHDDDLLPAGGDRDDWETAREDRVMEMARYWSVDPTTLDDRDDVPDTGLLGFR